MKRTTLILVAAVVALLCRAGLATADPITYTESATATGTLGTTAFTNASITITFVGDTSNVTGPDPTVDNRFLSGPGAATVSIAGISGTATFTDPFFVVDNPVLSRAGIFDNALSSCGGPGTACAIAGTINSAFSTYDLKSSIGPITGPHPPSI